MIVFPHPMTKGLGEKKRLILSPAFFSGCVLLLLQFSVLPKKEEEETSREKRSQFGKEFSLGPAYIRGFTLLRQSSSSERGNAKLGSTEKELVRHYSAIQPS